MWNAGVIAISHKHAGIFDKALAIYDEIRPRSRYFAVDQLACSLAFPEYGALEAAAPWFDHYWANRPWFNRAGEQFLSLALLEGLSPNDARARLRTRPIIGVLDARQPWWATKLHRLIAPSYPPNDEVPDSND